jgi:hypothetical protein
MATLSGHRSRETTSSSRPLRWLSGAARRGEVETLSEFTEIY